MAHRQAPSISRCLALSFYSSLPRLHPTLLIPITPQTKAWPAPQSKPCHILYILAISEQSVSTQYDEHTIAEEQAHSTYDKTNLDHMLLLDETRSVSQGIGRCTDGEHHTH